MNVGEENMIVWSDAKSFAVTSRRLPSHDCCYRSMPNQMGHNHFLIYYLHFFFLLNFISFYVSWWGIDLPFLIVESF